MLKESYQHIRKQLAAEGAFQVSNLYGTLSVLVEAVCLTVGFVALFQVPHFSWMYWALQIFLGSSILRYMAIQHECTHKTLFRQTFWNTCVGCLISPLSLHPYLPWRELHHQHHQWTGIADRDPAEAHLLKLRRSVNLHHLYRLAWKIWLPIAMIHYVVEVYWLYPFAQLKQGQKAGWKGVLSILMIVVPHLIVMISLGITDYLILFLPMFWILFLGIETIGLAGHAGLSTHLSETHPQPIPYLEQDEVTRTMNLPSILAVLVAYNFNLHTEHHLFPYAPWYRLPQIQQKIQDAVGLKYHNAEFFSHVAESRDRDPVELFIQTLPVVSMTHP